MVWNVTNGNFSYHKRMMKFKQAWYTAGITISVLRDMRWPWIATIDEGSNGALVVVVANNRGFETPLNRYHWRLFQCGIDCCRCLQSRVRNRVLLKFHNTYVKTIDLCPYFTITLLWHATNVNLSFHIWMMKFKQASFKKWGASMD